MIYQTASDWQQSESKRVMLFGMSGLGKTHVSNILRESGLWFHYSVDYRIGTRYMGEHIVDNFKREAMQNPFLANLLRSDSIYIASNITFNNLAPLSTYLGKPGAPEKGGLPFGEYQRRQNQHHVAERAALLDSAHFIARAKTLYGYDNFICDSGGSICEIIDPNDPNDETMTALSASMLLVWIKGTEEHTEELVRRFDKAPKPMCYQAQFLVEGWNQYLNDHSLSETEVDPDLFVRWLFRRALEHRQPRYAAMADNWGLTVTAKDVAKVTSAQAFNDLISMALENR